MAVNSRPDLLAKLYEIAPSYDVCDVEKAVLARIFDVAITQYDTKRGQDCLHWLASRLFPPYSEPPVSLNLNGANGMEMLGQLLDHVSQGKITPSEAVQLSRVVDTQLKHAEHAEIMQKLEDLEASLGSPPVNKTPVALEVIDEQSSHPDSH